MRWIVAAAVLILSAPALAGGGPSETVVLLNEASADSVRVAEHYVAQRGIPPTQVCRVRCATDLSVDVDDFVRDVVDPLRDFLRERDLEERCRFVVLTQGMPIRARAGGRYVSTAAALTLLDTPVCGSDQARLPAFPNPLRTGASHPLFTGRHAFMVTALISTTADEAIGLVDRSVASDGTAPDAALFVYQDAAGAAKRRNATYDAARRRIESSGHRTEHAVHGADEVQDRKRVMGYMSGGSYSKLTIEGVGTNEYPPGAICDMLQSFGAVPENFTPGAKTRQFPVTHMVRAGITGVHGAVAEPYDIAFPDADLFLPYVEGWTLAEAFHRHIPYGYWMNLVLGDPLCAPYGRRPVVEVARAATGWTGSVQLAVSAATAARIDAYVDGRRAATLEGTDGVLTIDSTAFADGDHHVLVEAVGTDAAASRGWTVISARFHNAAAEAPAPPPPPAPAALRVEAPAAITAGGTAAVRVTALDSAGEPMSDWHGRVEVRSADPPVRWVAADASGGALELPLTMLRAGTLRLSATAPAHALGESFELRVDPAAAAHATTPLNSFPIGQAMDMEVHVLDRYGNRTPWEGTLRLELPGDPHGTLPAPVTLAARDGGRAVFRDVLVTQPGRRQLVFKDAGGRTWSAAGEGLTASSAGLRAWLLGRALTGKGAGELFEGQPGAAADSDGAVGPTGPFRRHRDGNDEIDLPAGGTGDGDALVAVAHVEALGATPVRISAAARGRLRILVDGEPVHDGVPKSTDPRGKRAQVAELTLAQGRHRVTVVVQRAGRFSFALGLEDAGGAFPGTLRVRPSSGAAPAGRCASGRVRLPGGRGVAGVAVTAGAHTATSAADGAWWLSGLEEGPLTLSCARADGPSIEPSVERSVELAGAHAVDVDFVLTDDTAPTVTLPELPARPVFGRRLRLAARVQDADVVRSVRLLVDGEPHGPALTRAPWDLSADVAGLPRGSHELVVVASDASGNEGRSDPVAIRLIDDAEGPKVGLRGLSRNGLLRKKATITATATDPLGVETVAFELDGKALGAPRSEAPYSVDLDPEGLEAGRHELVCVATDTDGNETRTTLPFRSK